MKTAISSLQEKREAFDKMKKNCEDTVTHIQVQYLIFPAEDILSAWCCHHHDMIISCINMIW